MEENAVGGGIDLNPSIRLKTIWQSLAADFYWIAEKSTHDQTSYVFQTLLLHSLFKRVVTFAVMKVWRLWYSVQALNFVIYGDLHFNRPNETSFYSLPHCCLVFPISHNRDVSFSITYSRDEIMHSDGERVGISWKKLTAFWGIFFSKICRLGKVKRNEHSSRREDQHNLPLLCAARIKSKNRKQFLNKSQN